MTAPQIVDLDEYERKKLRMLIFEKFNALFMCFMFVVVVLYSALLLAGIAYDIYIVLTYRPPDAAAVIWGDLILLLMLSVVIFILYLGLYFSRASAQSRPRFIRWVRVLLLPIVLAVAYLIYTVAPLNQIFAFIWRLYTAHWATTLEVIVVLIATAVSTPAYFRGNRTMARLVERDKTFLREDPEGEFYRGRVVRTALGIPRIVDLMPRRRWLTSAQFVLANFFFTLSVGWMLVYVGFFSYRWIVVLEAYGGSVTHPYVQQTAVSHMLYSLVASLLAYCVPPLIGGYMLTAAQRNVRWSITQLLEADDRPPILFLRAFNDDQVQLQNVKLTLLGRAGRWLDGVSNLDRLLLDEGTPYGPVVAIGNPTDSFPPYGAARGYFDDKTWQAAVADLAGRARVIVVCLDRTEGIWWEVGHIAGLGYLSKTLFLLHPKYAAAHDNYALGDEVAKKLGQHTQDPSADWARSPNPGRHEEWGASRLLSR